MRVLPGALIMAVAFGLGGCERPIPDALLVRSPEPPAQYRELARDFLKRQEWLAGVSQVRVSQPRPATLTRKVLNYGQILRQEPFGEAWAVCVRYVRHGDFGIRSRETTKYFFDNRGRVAAWNGGVNAKDAGASTLDCMMLPEAAFEPVPI